MRRMINKLRLFLCTFSGEDDYIIRLCNTKIQFWFAFIGLFVILIFAGCWISASSFVSELFAGKSPLISIPIGILWGLLVANMYLLLLYTVSPTLLPTAKRKKKGKTIPGNRITEDQKNRPNSAFTVSFILRLLFISLLAIIIAQPINVLALKGLYSSSLNAYKTEYRINMIVVADSSLIKQEIENKAEFYKGIKLKNGINTDDILAIEANLFVLNKKVEDDREFLLKSRSLLDSLTKLNKRNVFNRKLACDSIRNELSALLDKVLKSDDDFIKEIGNTSLSDSTLQAEVEKYKNSLSNTIAAKKQNYERLTELLGKSNFYLKRMQILLAEQPAAWVITVIICLVFLLPVYWKFTIRNRTEFYEKKKHIENLMVHDDYNDFKKTYSFLLERSIHHYNRRVWVTMLQLAKKIKDINPQREAEFVNSLKTELADETVEKYEFWADPPFRTKRKGQHKLFLSEQDLLNTIYSE